VTISVRTCLEAIRQISPEQTRFTSIHAANVGLIPGEKLDESTAILSAQPFTCVVKLYALDTINYRESFDLHADQVAILFNH